MFLFSQKGDIIVQGDYNARTGDIQETVMDDDNTFLNVPEDYENDEQCLRRSQDSGTVNARGRNFLETCTALNLRILNGKIIVETQASKRDQDSKAFIEKHSGSSSPSAHLPHLPKLSSECIRTYIVYR